MLMQFMDRRGIEMAYQEIQYDVAERIATITLNRPERLNAWTPIMGQEVRAAMRQAADDEGVRVIVLTGAGRGFCAGADMGNLSSLSEGQRSRAALEAPGPFDPGSRPDFQKPYSYFPTVPKPIIGAINGPCAGLGFVIALYCDMRFAAPEAQFTTAFSRRGLIAEHGISWMLPTLIGLSAALDLLLSARRVGAEEALRLRLVDRVTEPGGLLGAVRAYASELRDAVSPRSMRVMKRQLWESRFQTLAEAIDVADREMVASFEAEDFREGVRHFVEKRPPSFTGR
jgi:enoyl-CoA hydratase/carnithine racemase